MNRRVIACTRNRAHAPTPGDRQTGALLLVGKPGDLFRAAESRVRLQPHRGSAARSEAPPPNSELSAVRNEPGRRSPFVGGVIPTNVVSSPTAAGLSISAVGSFLASMPERSALRCGINANAGCRPRRLIRDRELSVAIYAFISFAKEDAQ